MNEVLPLLYLHGLSTTGPALEQFHGSGAGLSISAVNLAPLLISTFTWTIRPAAHDIFALRRQATLRVAAEAADTAILDERDAPSSNASPAPPH